MTTRQITAVLVLAVVVVLVGWDVYTLAAHGSEPATISELVRDVAFNHPMIPFGLGVLVGHWFWPVAPMQDGGKL